MINNFAKYLRQLSVFDLIVQAAQYVIIMPTSDGESKIGSGFCRMELNSVWQECPKPAHRHYDKSIADFGEGIINTSLLDDPATPNLLLSAASLALQCLKQATSGE